MRYIYRFPLLNILIILALTIFFALQLPDIRLDNDVLTFLPADHPARLAVVEQQKLFGGVLLIDVAVEAREGSIISPGGLALLAELDGGFREIEGVQEVESIFSTDYLEATPEGMRSSPIASREGPWDGETADAVRWKLASWKIYDRLLISPDYSATQIGVRYDTGLDAAQREGVFREILEITSEHEGEGFNFYVAGTPAMTTLVSRNMTADLKTLIPFVLAVLILVLSLAFRRPGGVLLPLLTVSISTVWIIGIMALLEVSLSVLGTVIPVLMLAVGSAYAIHLTSHYYDGTAGFSGGKEEQRRLVLAAVDRTGPPVLTAGLTTVAGFGSLVVSRVIPMRVFGIFTAAGVLIAILVALLFLPSVLLLQRPPRAEAGSRQAAPPKRPMGRLLSLLNTLATRRRGAVLFGLVLLVLLSSLGTGRLIVDNALIDYFKEETDIRVSDTFIREKFAGTKSFDVIVRGPGPGSLTDPAILDAMDRMARHLESDYQEVARVVSYSDFIRRMNMVMHAGLSGSPEEKGDHYDNEESDLPLDSGSFFEEEPFAGGDDSFFSESDYEENEDSRGGEPAGETEYLSPEEYDEIPLDPRRYGLADAEELCNLISQYLLIYSGNLDAWSDDDLEPGIARMSVALNTSGNLFTNKLIPEIEAWAGENFPPGYSLETAGIALAESAVTDLITGAAVGSILLSLCLVFTIVAISYRSFAAGLYGAVPLGLTVLVNFGVMGWTGIKLDIATAMVGSLAIGIGIDYTIHFLAAYRRERLASDDTSRVTAAALEGSGKAIIYNALSVAAGFLVLAFSRFNPLMYLGILVSLTMITSSLASLTVIPVLLNTLRPRFISRPTARGGRPLFSSRSAQ